MPERSYIKKPPGPDPPLGCSNISYTSCSIRAKDDGIAIKSNTANIQRNSNPESNLKIEKKD
jgi:hypothetical protein